MDAFLEAAREIIDLQNAEIKEIVADRPRLERFDLALEVARERRERAKLAYMLHVREHGC